MAPESEVGNVCWRGASIPPSYCSRGEAFNLIHRFIPMRTTAAASLDKAGRLCSDSSSEQSEFTDGRVPPYSQRSYTAKICRERNQYANVVDIYLSLFGERDRAVCSPQCE